MVVFLLLRASRVALTSIVWVLMCITSLILLCACTVSLVIGKVDLGTRGSICLLTLNLARKALRLWPPILTKDVLISMVCLILVLARALIKVLRLSEPVNLRRLVNLRLSRVVVTNNIVLVFTV